MTTRFQKIKQGLISEAHEYDGKGSSARVGPLASDNIIDDVDVGIFNVQDPKVLDRLNTYVTAIGNAVYANPEYALRRLRDKLALVGFHIDFNGFPDGVPDEAEYPISLYGGRSGFLNDGSDQVSSDDGISYKTGESLVLRCEFEAENGGYSIFAQIVPSESEDESGESDPFLDSSLNEAAIPYAGYTGPVAKALKAVERKLRYLLHSSDTNPDGDPELAEYSTYLTDLHQGVDTLIMDEDRRARNNKYNTEVHYIAWVRTVEDWLLTDYPEAIKNITLGPKENRYSKPISPSWLPELERTVDNLHREVSQYFLNRKLEKKNLKEEVVKSETLYGNERSLSPGKEYKVTLFDRKDFQESIKAHNTGKGEPSFNDAYNKSNKLGTLRIRNTIGSFLSYKYGIIGSNRGRKIKPEEFEQWLFVQHYIIVEPGSKYTDPNTGTLTYTKPTNLKEGSSQPKLSNFDKQRIQMAKDSLSKPDGSSGMSHERAKQLLASYDVSPKKNLREASKDSLGILRKNTQTLIIDLKTDLARFRKDEHAVYDGLKDRHVLVFPGKFDKAKYSILSKDVEHDINTDTIYINLFRFAKCIKDIEEIYQKLDGLYLGQRPPKASEEIMRYMHDPRVAKWYKEYQVVQRV